MIPGDPSLATIDRIADLWTSIGRHEVFDGTIFEGIKTFTQSGTHLQGNQSLRRLLADAFTVELIGDPLVHFQYFAASIVLVRIRYFERGPLVDAVLASSAMPGLLPPVEVDGRHYLDGGLVASIPLDRAIGLGATATPVPQVGRIEAPLAVPTKPREVAMETR